MKFREISVDNQSKKYKRGDVVIVFETDESEGVIHEISILGKKRGIVLSHCNVIPYFYLEDTSEDVLDCWKPAQEGEVLHLRKTKK